MNFSLFGYAVTLSGHYYRRGRWHQCEFKDCPSRLPPAKIKYVIANRIAGSYSERFDSREDVERALNYFAAFNGMAGTKRYEILESVQVGGGWIIGDPQMPSNEIWPMNTKELRKFLDTNGPIPEEHGCTSCRACEVSHCRICAPCGKPEPPPKGVSSRVLNDLGTKCLTHWVDEPCHKVAPGDIVSDTVADVDCPDCLAEFARLRKGRELL